MHWYPEDHWKNQNVIFASAKNILLFLYHAVPGTVAYVSKLYILDLHSLNQISILYTTVALQYL